MATETAELAAGIELDRLIGEKVFGYKIVKTEHGYYRTDDIWTFENQMGWIPDYSTDIADAFEVVDAMLKQGFEPFMHHNNDWTAGFSFDNIGEQADAPALPLAICRAALQALAAVTSPPHSR